MWTILVNFGEYAHGVYKSEKYAQEKLWEMVETDTEDDILSYEMAVECCQGYYEIVEIKGV